MTVPPPHRLLRASAFTVVCVSLTLAGHVWASRAGVPWTGVAVGGPGVLVVAWVLAGHERSGWTILGGLLGGQFGLHALFAAMQAGSSVPAGPGSQAGHAGHAGHGAAVAETVSASAGPGMTLAHVAAATASAWWLWRGERLAWSLARRLAAFARACVAVPAGPVPVPVRRRVVAVVRAAGRPRAAALRHSVGLRGPPFRSVFATH
ncbi:hypothetical protein [Thermomonospora umbrina]|uniref:Uncharacterized protein n=1 Tax=Thermomonospora umbrina TaxID=111806 RepID=A0A3D9SFP3_9ACTN|nr:hypothetical protein [Thermomonospora umbrina]REE94726.1 hypothetical protein DFJ69_0074 [Thermomonospora umbrina]